LARDTYVIITGWTDALIPWPRCRSLEARGGGSGILVDELLAFAVRHESATAIKHWWLVSTTTVWWWRKSLGVKRADPEGSQRLIQAAAEMGAEENKCREYSDEERAECAQRAKELNLAQYLQTGYHGPLWTAEQVALLGTMPDDELAALLGKSIQAVYMKREKLGIQNPSKLHWTVEQIALLGNLPDWEVSEKIGRTTNAVTLKRIALRIPNQHDRRHRGRTR
jgi:hypothetical protein